MAELLTRIRSILTFCLAIVYLSNQLIKSDFMNNLALILLVAVIALSFTVVTGTSKVIGYASFALSMIILFLYHAPLSIWKQALEENLYLIIMFTLVPLLGIPIQHGGYFESL
ncbi:MAG: C4-dicarboxylate ABC transporter, partial [Bacillota bacterium]|nr:C4-dicarboxylate ABC transporter [Bacillota bacterium]